MNSKYSFRQIKNSQIANQNNLIVKLKPLKKEDITLNSIPKLRQLGYDPFDIIKLYDIDKNVLNMYRQIGLGCSPWIQLAYFIAVY
jgi:hypothetical protein